MARRPLPGRRRGGPAPADMTVQLSALDVLPADAFDSRLAQVDGRRFGGAYVRGGHIVTGAQTAGADHRRAEPTGGSQTPWATSGLGAPSPWSDAAAVRSFRTDPLSRILSALRRLLRR